MNKRRRMLIGTMLLAGVGWTIDQFVRSGEPVTAAAAPSPSPENALVEQVEPPDLDSLLELFSNGAKSTPPLLLTEATRDLFAIRGGAQESWPGSSGVQRARTGAAGNVRSDDRHRLEGVITGDAPLAIIDGVVLRLGDNLDGFTLIEIQRDRVVLQGGELRVELRVALPTTEALRHPDQ